MKIGFIGTGVMGSSMVRNLIKGGQDVTVYNRTLKKAQELGKELNIEVASTIKDCIRDKDVVITIIGYPKDVEEVYFNEDGIINNANKGTYLIDMTTSAPNLAVRIGEEGKKKGLRVLDAPVSGGDKGAREGSLSIMVGGDKNDFEAMIPIFKLMGKSINLMGGNGFGQHTKAANQIVVAGNTAAYTEALVYAKSVGLDQEKMLNAISGGAAGSWQVSNMAPRALKGDLDPGFFIKHFIKDMKIIIEETKANNLSLEVLEKVLNIYEKMAESGKEDMGTQALITYYDDLGKDDK